ncbi:Transcriptional regulator SlyA [compost metagenome]
MITGPRDRFGIRFSVLARRWRTYIDHTLAASGLTDATWAPLVHLDRTGDGVPQKVLAERIGIDSSTLVRLIDILETRDLVERRTDPADRRARRLYLTPSGRQAVNAIKIALVEAEKRMLAGVSDAEIEAALVVFDKIDRRLGDTDEGAE